MPLRYGLDTAPRSSHTDLKHSGGWGVCARFEAMNMAQVSREAGCGIAEREEVQRHSSSLGLEWLVHPKLLRMEYEKEHAS